MSSQVGAPQGINIANIAGQIFHRVQDDKAPVAADHDFDQGAASALGVVIPDVAQAADADNRVADVLPGP